MIRKIRKEDNEIFLKLSSEFYNSEATLEPIPSENHIKTFEELIRSQDYLECFIFEHEDQIAGYGLISKTFSQESGGIVVWVEELYIIEQFRCFGLGTEFFKHLEDKIPATRYRLEIEEKNKRAKKLYNKLGYEILPYVQMVKETEKDE